jgi:uncharacterized membrane protein
LTSKLGLPKRGYLLSIFGGILVGASSVFEVVFILKQMGFSIFQEIVIGSEAKVFISLCLFLGLTAATLAFAGAYLLWKGYFTAGGFVNVVGGLLALSNIVVPFVYGYEVFETFSFGILIGFSLMAIGVELGSLSSVERIKGAILSSVEVAVIAVLSAVYAVMIILVTVPSPTGGYTHIGDTIVFIAALLFGWKVGGLVGITGSVVADLFVGYPRWFVSILAHGLEGVVPGLAKGKPLAIQVVACVLGGFLMATTYFFINIFMKGYPLALVSYVRDLFVQAGISIVIGLIIVNVLKKTVPRLAA